MSSSVGRLLSRVSGICKEIANCPFIRENRLFHIRRQRPVAVHPPQRRRINLRHMAPHQLRKGPFGSALRVVTQQRQVVRGGVGGIHERQRFPTEPRDRRNPTIIFLASLKEGGSPLVKWRRGIPGFGG